jgi:hypothetical protein
MISYKPTQFRCGDYSFQSTFSDEDFGAEKYVAGTDREHCALWNRYRYYSVLTRELSNKKQRLWDFSATLDGDQVQA